MGFPGEWEPRKAAPIAGVQDRVRSEPRADRGDTGEQRRERPVWFTISCGAATLLGAMLLVMWAQYGASACAVSFEAPRRLQLDRQVDREHLAVDSASAARAARRFVSTTGGGDQQRRFLECEERLVSAIAATHGVSVEQVRAAAANAR